MFYWDQGRIYSKILGGRQLDKGANKQNLRGDNNNNLFLPSFDILQKCTRGVRTRKKKKTQIINDYTVK